MFFGSIIAGARRAAGLAAVAALAFGWGGCGRGADLPILMAVGSYGDVALVASSDAALRAARPALDRINEPIDFVIKDEPPFRYDAFPGAKWKLSRNYKNLLFLVDWSEGGPVVKEAQRLLDEAARARLRAGDGVLAQVADPYATFQFAIIAAAPDRNSLASLLRRHEGRIRGMLEEENRARLRRQFAREGVRDDLHSRYWRQHRFLIEIPQAYRENQNQPGGFPGIEWVRNQPTRGITLAWEGVDDPSAALADRARLLALRRRMADRMHAEDLEDDTLAWEVDARLGRLPAVRLTGLWTSREISGGGAFWCYFVADPEGRRVFCLDLLAYAPDLDKVPLYREMLAIAESFSLSRPHP